MKKRRSVSKLWVAFAMITFLVLITTTIVFGGVFFFYFESRDVTLFHGKPIIFIIFLLLLSFSEGIILFSFVGKIILRPIMDLNEATKKVATGDFTVRVTSTPSRINEVSEMMRNFNKMVQDLARIETLQNDFVVNVSHEFKTPLAAIEGYATLLQDEQLDVAERTEYLQIIMESTQQLSRLSENVLKLSKLENQEAILDKKVFRLDEQIRQVILLLENKWSEKNIDIQVELEKLEYYSSESLLWQVWLNLIDNAIKFSKKNGEIRIGMRVTDSNVFVTVKDDGRGIAQDEIKHLFDKFYQGDSSRGEGGNGLGLPLAKRIVRLCNGGITVVSKENEGAEFVVTLPF